MHKNEVSSQSPEASSLYLVGQNSRGRWVVRQEKGQCGGVFVDRNEAVRFAMFECGHRPQAVVMVPGILELELGRSAPSGHAITNAPHPQRSQPSEYQ
jgi:hypothetical protein